MIGRTQMIGICNDRKALIERKHGTFMEAYRESGRPPIGAEGSCCPPSSDTGQQIPCQQYQLRACAGASERYSRCLYAQRIQAACPS